MVDTEQITQIHKAFMSFDKRAERASDNILEATFVDTGPLFDLIKSNNNQVVYGRRGTGKTHALKYLQGKLPAEEASVYVDLRSVGSNGSIYGDDSRKLSERAYTLIVDVLTSIGNELYVLAVEAIDRGVDAQQVSIRLDDFSHSISEVKVVGQIEQTTASEQSNKADGTASLSLSPTGLGLRASATAQDVRIESRATSRSGDEKVNLNFGRISAALSGLIQVLGVDRLWLLVDEWSEIPLALQPYLADLLRRTVLPLGKITVKIAAIDHRSNFILQYGRGEYVGLELGADITADLNLDDFLVFDNNQEKATDFFKTLLFRHYKAQDEADTAVGTPEELIQGLFTQAPAFEEFVRAVEGVPRDALNLATKVATKAFGQLISIAHVRQAARDWYQQDKHAVVRNNGRLETLLNKVIEEVIGNRKARAFLLQSGLRVEEVDQLFDARILHVLKKNISSHDEPGVRYDVFKIDYGCYVDMINTAKAPLTLFEAGEDSDLESVEVPKDDYRSIRRAILKPEFLVA